MSSAKLLLKKMVWRFRNKNNFTTVGNPSFPLSLVSVGEGTYGKLNVHAYGSLGERLDIGRYCSIAEGVTFILGGEHDTSLVSTYPFEAMYGSSVCAISKGPIIIEDDVWIGFGATILSGVIIKQGAVIAAGSLVVHDVSPYTVVGGVPARKIKTRFDEATVIEATRIDYSRLNLHHEQSVDVLQSKASMDSIRELERILNSDSGKEGVN